MMNKAIHLLLILFFVETAQAITIQGVLVNQHQQPLANQLVFLNNGVSTSTNQVGQFKIDDLLRGEYELKTEMGGQIVVLHTFKLTESTPEVNLGIITVNNNVQLKEAEIRDVSGVKTIERMPDVKDNVIYAGKKTEVVRLTTATANLAQNNSRQIFAKVPGIHVWESDGSGVQMGIASRGLSPNRMWEFNTRQNGYDIAADPFGYPEAYYTPSVESLDRIEVIRGAASLQYGPQFGGVVNYIKKRSISGKKFGVESMQTSGSNGLFSTFNAIGGNVGKFTYYANVNYRRSDGWRINNGYNTWNGFVNLGYQLTSKIHISAEYTRMNQLVQQPGGLTDSMFAINAQQSVRNRNWFKLIWNIAAINVDYQITSNHKLNIKAFGLSGNRNSIGFMSDINIPDIANTAGNFALRTIDKDAYENYGVEVRHLYSYQIGKQKSALALGGRYYRGNTDRIQNKFGNRGASYDLSTERDSLNRNLNFEAQNLAFFAENLFNITNRLSLTPGVRIEVLDNQAEGILDAKPVNRSSSRSFALLGLGIQYKLSASTNIYGNITQCYRPVLFSDISVATTDSINPNLKDGNGYNIDLGYRGSFGKVLNFDVSAYYLYYGNRIGTYTANGKNYRTNIGSSESKGVEAFTEFVPTAFLPTMKIGTIQLFASIAFIQAKYLTWNDPDATKNQQGKFVENAPQYIHRFGLTYRYKVFTTTFQYSMVGEAYADALNTEKANARATVGVIPAYQVADWSMSLQLLKKYQINGGINNVFNKHYFTRRAGGYPGPGLLPAEGRMWYIGIGLKF